MEFLVGFEFGVVATSVCNDFILTLINNSIFSFFSGEQSRRDDRRDRDRRDRDRDRDHDRSDHDGGDRKKAKCNCH